MNIGGIISGAIAAIIGAAVWAAVAYFLEVEVGYLAWGIGLLVGLAVSSGSSTGGVGAAAVAVIFTVLSLLGGKYASVTMAVRDIDVPAFEMDDESVKTRLAFKSIEDSGQDPANLKFRNGTNYDTSESLNDLPADIAKQAQNKFDAMSTEEIEEVKSNAKAEYDTFIAEFKSQFTQQGFENSFSGFDIIFFLLGIATAGKVAFSDVINEN